jgi:hypothetical protein
LFLLKICYIFPASVSECEDTLESSQETIMSQEDKIDHLKSIIDSVHAKHQEQEESEVFDSDAEESSDPLGRGRTLSDRKFSSGCYTQEAREEDYKSRFPMEDFHSMEKQSAKDYVVCLLQVLPSLLDIPSISELDETLQTFASNFCTGRINISRFVTSMEFICSEPNWKQCVIYSVQYQFVDACALIG